MLRYLFQSSRLSLIAYTFGVLSFVWLTATYTNAQVVVIAGGGITIPSTTEESATSAQLDNPFGAVVDSSGNLYIADSGHNLIEKIDIDGDIVVVAGGGTTVPTTSAESALSAKLSNPTGIALDTNGNLYIADDNNNQIEKVDLSTGEIVVVVHGGTVQGTDTIMAYPYYVAVDASGNLYFATSGRVYYSPSGTGLIYKFAGGGPDGGSYTPMPAGNLEFIAITGIALDSNNNLYIVDESEGRVYEVPAGSGEIVEVAGGGANTPTTTAEAADLSYLYQPSGIAVDSGGNVYIGQIPHYNYGSDVWKLNTSASTIALIAGGGIVTPSTTPESNLSSKLGYTSAVATDASGNLYLADYLNEFIEKVSF